MIRPPIHVRKQPEEWPLPLVIFDTSYIAHRAKWSSGHLSHNGQPTGVLYGVLNQVNRFRRLFPANAAVVFAWDSRTSRRREIFPAYKSERNKEYSQAEQVLRKEFSDQLSILRAQVLEPVGFAHHVGSEGLEADDAIADLVFWADKNPNIGRVWIVSSDDDLFQLLDKATLFRPHQERNYTKTNLMEDWGLTPQQWIEATAIAGTHNGVPGVKNVGLKTAAAYLKGGRVSDTRKQAIKDSERTVRRNIKLIRLPFLHTKIVPKGFDPKPFVANSLGLRAVREKFGFKSMRVEEWT